MSPETSTRPQPTRELRGLDRLPLIADLATYWWAIVLPGVVLALVGVVLGLSRPPVYTATSELNVGEINIATQAIPGFTQGGITLASAYSRLAKSETVAKPVGRQLGISTGEALDSISAAPIPDETIFRVQGKSGSKQRASQIAQASTREVIKFADRLNLRESGVNQIIGQYRIAQTKFLRLRADEKALRAKQPDGSPAVQKAQLATTTANLQARSLANAYAEGKATVQGGAGSDLQVINPATRAHSDRGSVTQQYAFAGLLAGLLLGLAAAVGLGRRRWRRSLRV